MKVGKYILLSTTVLGLVNPLVVLADDQANSPKNESQLSSNNENESKKSEEESKSTETADKGSESSDKSKSETDNSKAQTETKDDTSKVATASQTMTWGDTGLSLTLDDDGTLHLPSGEVTTETQNTIFSTLIKNGVDRLSVKKIIIDGPLKIKNGNSIFAMLPNLSKIESLENLDTSSVTSMNGMFRADGSLVSLDLSNFDTSNVTDMSQMFQGASSLTTLDLSNFDTSNVTDMSQMFQGASSLTTLDLSNFDTSNVKYFTSMFEVDKALTKIEVSNFTGESNISTIRMFLGCENLERLDLSKMSINKPPYNDVDSTAQMFGAMRNLKYLDIRNLDLTDNNSNEMFYDDFMLQTFVSPKKGSIKNTDLNSAGMKLEPKKYSGHWQEVGNGTIDNPTGRDAGTNDEFVANYDGEKDAGTYVWQRNKAEDITVEYVDIHGNPIPGMESKTLTGLYGDDYKIEKPKIDGYTYYSSYNDYPYEGQFDDVKKDFKIIYAKNSNITEKFIDEDGNPIPNVKDKIIDGYDGLYEMFIMSHPDANIDGYAFVGFKETVNDHDDVGVHANGDNTFWMQFTDKDQTIHAIYKKISDIKPNTPTKPLADGTVTAKYVDESGKEISNPVKIDGKAGDEYKTEQKNIPGYVFKEVKGNTTGKLTSDPQTVTYIYKPVTTNTPTKPVADGKVMVKYVDDTGKEIAKSEILSGKAGDDYKSEKKDIDGYKFKEVQGNETGKFSAFEQTVTYVYTKDGSSSENPTNPVNPNDPNKPNDSGNTDTNGNDSGLINNVVNNVVDGGQSLLPKTSAEKITLAGVVSVVLASLFGLIVWKKRK